jgi:hypothetical protein
MGASQDLDRRPKHFALRRQDRFHRCGIGQQRWCLRSDTAINS